jgi:hypothetical protein
MWLWGVSTSTFYFEYDVSKYNFRLCICLPVLQLQVSQRWPDRTRIQFSVESTPLCSTVNPAFFEIWPKSRVFYFNCVTYSDKPTSIFVFNSAVTWVNNKTNHSPAMAAYEILEPQQQDIKKKKSRLNGLLKSHFDWVAVWLSLFVNPEQHKLSPVRWKGRNSLPA